MWCDGVICTQNWVPDSGYEQILAGWGLVGGRGPRPGVSIRILIAVEISVENRFAGQAAELAIQIRFEVAIRPVSYRQPVFYR